MQHTGRWFNLELIKIQNINRMIINEVFAPWFFPFAYKVNKVPKRQVLKATINKNNGKATSSSTTGPLDVFCWIHLLLTRISSSDNLLQDLLFESTQQSLHNQFVVCAGGESYQGGVGGCTRQLHLNKGRDGNRTSSSDVTDYGFSLEIFGSYLEHLLMQVGDRLARQRVSAALTLRIPGDGGPGLGLQWHVCIINKCGAYGQV